LPSAEQTLRLSSLIESPRGEAYQNPALAATWTSIGLAIGKTRPIAFTKRKKRDSLHHDVGRFVEAADRPERICLPPNPYLLCARYREVG